MPFLSDLSSIFNLCLDISESEASGGDVGEIGGDKAQGDTKQGSDWLHDWGVDSLTSQLQSTVCDVFLSVNIIETDHGFIAVTTLARHHYLGF